MESAARLVNAVTDVVINPIIALIFTAALFLFLYGSFMLVVNAGNDAARADGKRHMLWGIIGMVIMVSVFALLNIGLNTLGVDKTKPPEEGGLPAEHPLR